MEARTTKLEKIKKFIKSKWKWIAGGAIALVALLVSLFQRRETRSMLQNQKDTSEKILNAEKESRERLEKAIEEIKIEEEIKTEKVKEKFKSEKKKLESIKEEEKTKINSLAKSIADLTGAEHVEIDSKK